MISPILFKMEYHYDDVANKNIPVWKSQNPIRYTSCGVVAA